MILGSSKVYGNIISDLVIVFDALEYIAFNNQSCYFSSLFLIIFEIKKLKLKKKIICIFLYNPIY